jgi:hypothetical protein
VEKPKSLLSVGKAKILQTLEKAAARNVRRTVEGGRPHICNLTRAYQIEYKSNQLFRARYTDEKALATYVPRLFRQCLDFVKIMSNRTVPAVGDVKSL